MMNTQLGFVMTALRLYNWNVIQKRIHKIDSKSNDRQGIQETLVLSEYFAWVTTDGNALAFVTGTWIMKESRI